MPNIYNSSIVVLGGGAEKPVDNGMIYEGKCRVRYFDVDGSILKIEYVAEGGKLTPPTKTPNYDPDYLIFDEWNYDIENYVVEQPTDVGATYKTVDDATYLFCRCTAKTGLVLKIAITGYTSIDWGDGTVDTNVSHTYAEEGEYLIKIYGNITFNTASSTYLLGGTGINRALKKCYIKNGVISIGQYTFRYCYSLTNVSIPKSVTSIGQYTFANCYGLTNVSIPKSVTSIEQYTFNYCCSLTNVSISDNIGYLTKSAFQYCYSLTSMSIPKSVKNLGGSLFEYCYSLKSVSIPKSVREIGDYTFASCSGLTNYFIYCDIIPTLQNTVAFDNINAAAIMWVNDNIIEQLKVANNWSTYANRMKPLSWYPSLTDPNA